MFITNFKHVLAAVLVLAGIAGPMSKLPGAEDAKAKEETTDQERILGNWYIVNDDSQRQGEMWVIYEDGILMCAKCGGARAVWHSHHLDATRDPKQIDITVTKVRGSPDSSIGVIKGLYALEGDELRLCLAEMGKDRPVAFPQKPGLGEVLVLHRDRGAGQTKATEEPAAKNEQVVLTPEEAIKQRDQENVTVQFEVASVETIITSGVIPKGAKVSRLWVRLKDGNSFSVQLRGRVTYQIGRLGIDPARHFNDKVVRVTGEVQHIESAGNYQIVVNDLDQIEVVGR